MLSLLQELFITAKYVEKRFLPRSRTLPGRPPEAALWDAVTAGDVRHAPGPNDVSMFSIRLPFDAAERMGLQQELCRLPSYWRRLIHDNLEASLLDAHF